MEEAFRREGSSRKKAPRREMANVSRDRDTAEVRRMSGRRGGKGGRGANLRRLAFYLKAMGSPRRF